MIPLAVEEIQLAFPRHMFSNPQDTLSFCWLEGFMDEWTQLGLNSELLKGIQLYTAAAPQENTILIPDTDGLCELLFKTDQFKGGELSLLYVYFEEHSLVYLVSIDQGATELTAEDKRDIRKLIEELRLRLDEGIRS